LKDPISYITFRTPPMGCDIPCFNIIDTVDAAEPGLELSHSTEINIPFINNLLLHVQQERLVSTLRILINRRPVKASNAILNR
jgi:hypothetical protein